MRNKLLRKLGVTVAFLATLYSGCFEQLKPTPEQELEKERNALREQIKPEVDKLYSFLKSWRLTRTIDGKHPNGTVILTNDQDLQRIKDTPEGESYPVPKGPFTKYCYAKRI